MADVFISYKREDRTRIARLAQAIERHGFTVWWDLDLVGGERWSKRIKAELDAAKCVVVVWSNQSIASDDTYVSEWVENEADVGANKGILVPAMVDAGRIAWTHSKIQLSDLTTWSGEDDHPGLISLMAGISAHAGERERPNTPEIDAWNAVENSSDPAQYRAFLRDHGQSRFAEIARTRIAELNAPKSDAFGTKDLPETETDTVDESPAPVAPIHLGAGAIFGAMLVAFGAFLLQFSPNVVLASIKMEFGLSDLQIGVLIGSESAIWATAGTVIGAFLVDRLGVSTRTTFLVALLLAAALTAVMTLSTSFVILSGLRIPALISLGALFPALYAHIGRSQTSLGLKFGSVGAVSSIAGLVLFAGYRAATGFDLSWREILLYCTILAGVTWIGAFVFARSGTPQSSEISSHVQPSSHAVRMTGIAAFFALSASSVLLSTRNAFLSSTFEPEFRDMSSVLFPTGAGLGVLGAVLAGILADRVFGASTRAYQTLGAVAALMAGLSTIGLTVSPSVFVAIVFVAIGAFGVSAFITSIYAATQSAAPQNHRATSAAFPLIMGSLGQLVLVPVVFSVLNPGPESGYRDILTGSAGLWVIAAAILFFGRARQLQASA